MEESYLKLDLASILDFLRALANRNIIMAS